MEMDGFYWSCILQKSIRDKFYSYFCIIFMLMIKINHIFVAQPVVIVRTHRTDFYIFLAVQNAQRMFFSHYKVQHLNRFRHRSTMLVAPFFSLFKLACPNILYLFDSFFVNHKKWD